MDINDNKNSGQKISNAVDVRLNDMCEENLQIEMLADL